jgi:hypothetical protein
MRHVNLFALILSFLHLSNCARVKIYDDPWCADAGKFGAKCFNTISNTEFSLNKYEWDKLRVGQICSATEKPGEGYVHIKVPLEKFCADSRYCSVEDKTKLENVSKKADTAISSAGKAPPFNTPTKGK